MFPGPLGVGGSTRRPWASGSPRSLTSLGSSRFRAISPSPFARIPAFLGLGLASLWSN
ncbi:MAG: hypothetical protein LBL95_05185 [Deltaproteobacteria bacterium]|nr:hypothetical protein [Deltaproteobacteria bacterium]